VLPQQEPSALASACVPQHGLLTVAGSGRVRVAWAGLPQQPLVPVTDSAAAGSPLNPPLVAVSVSVSVMMISLGFDNHRIRLVSKPTLHAVSIPVKLDACRNQLER
jgi:hypothetical protein